MTGSDENGSHGGPSEPGEGINAEEDLDAVLAEAASLSADLSAGLGETKNQITQDPVEPAPDQADDVPADLDAELKEMEHLLQTASADLGTEAPEAETEEENKKEKEEEAGERAPSAGVTREIPDFMAEFTRPEAGDEPGTPRPDQLDKPSAVQLEKPVLDQPAQPSPEQVEKPVRDQTSPRAETAANVGVVGTGKVGVVGRHGTAGPRTEPTPQGPRRTPLEEGMGETSEEQRNGPLRSIIYRLFRVVLPLGEHCTRLLEILDKPTGGVSQATRRIIGWFALATLGTAAFVFVISLF